MALCRKRLRGALGNLWLLVEEMALYHFSAKLLSRSTRNTVQAAAYRAGCQLTDSRTHEVFDYRNKEVAEVALLLPEDAPSWAKALSQSVDQDREKGVQAFCDLAEGAERRVDSQVYREVEFALPRELTDAQGMALARGFLQRHFCRQGMAALACFHLEVDATSGERKPHCHALLLTRRLEASGLSRLKERGWNQVSALESWREAWAQEMNASLKHHGHEVRVDHRSYAAQGIEIEPQPKRGRGVQEMAARNPENLPERQALFDGVRLRNLYRICARPELVFELTTRQQATFMWGDVQRVLARTIDDAEVFQKMETRLKASKELIEEVRTHVRLCVSVVGIVGMCVN